MAAVTPIPSFISAAAGAAGAGREDVSSAAGLAAGSSPTTTKVSDFFAEYNAGLHRDFTSRRDPLYRDHFERNKKAILDAAEGLSGTALLLGVGGAHDLPLEELAKQFDRVDLVDIELSQVDEALSKIPEDLRAKFHTHAIDLTGIFSELEKTLDEMIKAGVSHEEFCDRATLALKAIVKPRFPYPEHSASFVVSSLVSSQLSHKMNEYLDTRSLQIFSKPFQIREKDMLDFADSLSKIEGAHMEDLSTLVTPSGKVYFADHFSFQAHKRIVLQTSHTLETSSKETNLYCASKVREIAEKKFNKMRESNWVWKVPISETNVVVPFTSGAIVGGKMTQYKYFGITSWMLSPKPA